MLSRFPILRLEVRCATYPPRCEPPPPVRPCMPSATCPLTVQFRRACALVAGGQVRDLPLGYGDDQNTRRCMMVEVEVPQYGRVQVHLTPSSSAAVAGPPPPVLSMMPLFSYPGQPRVP